MTFSASIVAGNFRKVEESFQKTEMPFRGRIDRAVPVALDGDALSTFLRRRHPSGTADHVSADIGISSRTVRGWLTGATKPGCDALAALLIAYGPPFLAAVLPDPPAWVSAAAREHELAALKAAQDAVEARIAALRDREG